MTSSVPQDRLLDRRYDLDWIRVGAFFLLILYHVGMFYVPWEWHVKSPHPVEALEPLMLLTSPWRLTLLFLVSGAATRFMADKVSAGALAAARTWRLLPPLIFAMVVIVPPQSYLQVAEYAAAHADAPFSVDPYGVFWLKYITASGHWCAPGGCLITPTWNHLWFVAYLLAYSLILAGALAAIPRLGARLQAGAERALSGWGLILWPLAFLTVARIFLMPRFDVTHALIDDWYNHAVSFPAFLLGFALAKSGPLRDRMIAARWVSLALAVIAYAAVARYSWVWRDDHAVPPPTALRLLMRGVYGLDQWAPIAAVLGFGAKHLNRDAPVLRYLTLAVFPFYIVHQTLIVVGAYYLARLNLPQGLEAAILIVGAFAGCFASYEIVRRLGWLRPLFGLKLQATASEARRPPALA